jgi:2,3-bisphosphoglycerate-independent phosphoglycerate mutase
MSKKKVCLMILDGWGHGRKDASDAIYTANTPNIDSYYTKYPSASLLTDGENVGLPSGQMGNSEVGHMNIGAGRVVYQDLLKINRAIESGEFQKNEVLQSVLQNAKAEEQTLHLIGLTSDGGVHSSLEHLKALCDLCQSSKWKHVYIHAFTDGRDTDPQSGVEFLGDLQQHIQGGPCKIASVVGRYYAMDRDQRWERVKLAYDLLVLGKGKEVSSAVQGLMDSYKSGVTDEFLKPLLVDSRPESRINDGDAVICFNFRTDRCREITAVLTQRDFPEFGMRKLDVDYTTMTNYDDSFHGVRVVYDKDNLRKTLGEVLAENGKSQLRVAETEKYPHVTFFFSGGREQPFELENRLMINSPKVATYDLQPEMSAVEVTQKVVNAMRTDGPDFICLNFANPDMVGHTGVYSAIVKACETIDRCADEVVKAGLSCGYTFIIIADHGNADYVVNDDGTPNTAHSLNPVPIIVLGSEDRQLQNGILADVAPTILDLMHIEQPEEMTGHSLLQS